nr:MAG TPA: hypothetical protein [Caudoviricetes sp.]
MVITYETPDRFTACRGSFYVYILVCPHSPAEPPRTGASPTGLYLYYQGQKARREPQRGTQRPRLHHGSKTAPRAAGSLSMSHALKAW